MRKPARSVLAALAVLGLLSLPGPAHASDYRQYMAFGDSITAGYPDFRTGEFTHGYPVYADVRRAGTFGTTAEQVASWWPELLRDLKNPPEVAVFLIGINDLVLGAPAATVIQRLQRLRRIGRSLDVRVVFGTITPAPLGSVWRSMEAERRAVNAWIKDQPVFVDFAATLTCFPGKYLCDQFVHPYWLDVHPNDIGQQLLGETLRTWIELDRA